MSCCGRTRFINRPDRRSVVSSRRARRQSSHAGARVSVLSSDELLKNICSQPRRGVLVAIVAQSAVPPDGPRGKDRAAFAGLEVNHVCTLTRRFALTAQRLENREGRIKEFLGHCRTCDHQGVWWGTHQHVCKIDFVGSRGAEKRPLLADRFVFTDT